MLELMWDDKRQFFFPVLKQDEERDGYQLKKLTRTYESGRYAGDTHGRELIGYVPWQFNLLPAGSKYDVAWKKLMDRDGFYADFVLPRLNATIHVPAAKILLLVERSVLALRDNADTEGARKLFAKRQPGTHCR